MRPRKRPILADLSGNTGKEQLTGAKKALIEAERELKELELFERKTRLGMAASFKGREGFTYCNEFSSYASRYCKDEPITIVMRSGEVNVSENLM